MIFSMENADAEWLNQTHVSASDPDATMVYRKGTDGGLKYKVHYSADVKTRIITDCYTTTGSTHEGPILPDRIDYYVMRRVLMFKKCC